MSASVNTFLRKHLPRSIAQHLRVLLYTRQKDVQYFNVLIASMSLWKYSASLVIILLWTEKKLFFVHFFFQKKKENRSTFKIPTRSCFLNIFIMTRCVLLTFWFALYQNDMTRNLPKCIACEITRDYRVIAQRKTHKKRYLLNRVSIALQRVPFG